MGRSAVEQRLFGSSTLLFLITFTLIGCQEASQKTDSMLFREAAIRDAQVHLEKANEYLTDEVKTAPREHLDSLYLAKNQLKDAKHIYQKNNISSFQDPKLETLDEFFSSLSPQLAEFAKQLLIEVIDKTVILRTQIEDAKTRPYSARGMDVGQMVEFLGDQYNDDVKGCCLRKLSKIDQLLQSEAKTYRDLLVLIRSINDELGEIIVDEAHAIELKRRLNSM